MMGQEDKICGGYILLSRKLIESKIMSKPPQFLKVWVWLLLRAQYADRNGIKRGQIRTSIPEIQESMTYNVGYRKHRPSKKEIWGILEWLRNPREGSTKVTMAVTTKVTGGMLITISNYDIYQNPKNYEGNDEGNYEGPTKVTTGEQLINKKVKRIKKENKKQEESTELPAWLDKTAWQSYRQHRTAVKKPMSATAERLALKRLEEFEKQGMSHASVLNQSVMNGWVGLFELKQSSNGNGVVPKEDWATRKERELKEKANATRAI